MEFKKLINYNSAIDNRNLLEIVDLNALRFLYQIHFMKLSDKIKIQYYFHRYHTTLTGYHIQGKGSYVTSAKISR